MPVKLKLEESSLIVVEKSRRERKVEVELCSAVVHWRKPRAVFTPTVSPAEGFTREMERSWRQILKGGRTLHCKRVLRVPAGIVNSLTSRHASGLCVGVGVPVAVSEVEGVAEGVPLEVPPAEKVVEGVGVPEGVAEVEGEPVGEGEGVGDCDGEGSAEGVTDGVGEAEGAAREKLKSYGQETKRLFAHSAHTQHVVPEAQAVGPMDHV
jgi:hypothetical protein